MLEIRGNHDFAGRRLRDSVGSARAGDRAIVALAPAGYDAWAAIAKDGARAARRSDLAGVKASCKSCHDRYKTKYKIELRTRPVTL